MRKIHISFIVLIICFILVLTLFFVEKAIVVSPIQTISLPEGVKKIGLLGFTPDPTSYLERQKDPLFTLKKIKLSDFLDINYLLDSYIAAFSLAQAEAIDLMVFVYLPAYFVKMRYLLNNNFAEQMSDFLKRIAHTEAILLIKKALTATGYKGKVMIFVPTKEDFEFLDHEITCEDERIRYFVKHFPRFVDLEKSDVQEFCIINNSGSTYQTEKLIDFFKYEYCLHKDLIYTPMYLPKRSFHGKKLFD